MLDSQSSRLTYCNAGHNPPILLGADGSGSELNSSGAILGKFPKWQYAQTSLSLNNGDTLLLFTDGVVEACDEQNEPFGEQRLMQTGQKFSGQNAARLQAALLNAVSGHCGKFQDDATMIVLQVKPQSAL